MPITSNKEMSWSQLWCQEGWEKYCAQDMEGT